MHSIFSQPPSTRWHFFSGYGTYLLIVAFTGVRHRFLKRDFRFGLNLVGPFVKPLQPSNKAAAYL